MENEFTITAVIPVKGDSSRLKNKNISPFGDSNLLIHKIQQLKQVEELVRIIVSSDSEKRVQKQSNVLNNMRMNPSLSVVFWSIFVI